MHHRQMRRQTGVSVIPAGLTSRVRPAANKSHAKRGDRLSPEIPAGRVTPTQPVDHRRTWSAASGCFCAPLDDDAG